MELVTYQIKPYFLLGEPLPFQSKNATDWLRKMINRIYNTNKAGLKKTGVRTELLHNHDEITSKTRISYPLIIYHYVDNRFYVTGINEGKETLKELLEPLNRAVEIDKNVLLKFGLVNEVQLEIKITDSEIHYQAIDWLPLGSAQYKNYKGITLTEKIKFLETKLLAHITKDFGKFLDIDLSGIMVKIISIDNLQRSKLPYKGQDFQPFTIDFTANVNLPDFITLGNGKAFGFGRVQRS
jgi:hypothetical protein